MCIIHIFITESPPPEGGGLTKAQSIITIPQIKNRRASSPAAITHTGSWVYSLKTTLKEKIADCKIEGGEAPEFLTKYEQEFSDALADDLNTADALGILFSLVKEINILITNEQGIDTLKACEETFLRLADVLGFLYVEKEESVDEEIEA